MSIERADGRQVVDRGEMVSSPYEPPEPGDSRGRGAGSGIFAVLLVAGFAVVEGIAVSAGYSGDYALASTLAIVVIVGTILSFVLGAAAVVLNAGRVWGLAAVVLSVLVNPFTLMRILEFFEGFVTQRGGV